MYRAEEVGILQQGQQWIARQTGQQPVDTPI